MEFKLGFGLRPRTYILLWKLLKHFQVGKPQVSLELSSQLEVTQANPPQAEKLEIGRGGSEGEANNLGILSVIQNGLLVPTAWSSYNLFSAIVTDPICYSS